MNPSNCALFCPLALATCCALLAACDSSVAELGVFPRELFEQDGSAAPDGASASPAPLAPSEALPTCLPFDCVTDTLLSYPGEHCYEVTAHAPGDADRPYSVAAAPEQYVKFTMRAPGDGAQYLRSVSALLDAKAVLHHMKLYEHQGALPEGVSTSPDVPPELRLVFSWHPGTQTMSLAPELGIALAPGAWYTLEAHYNNITGKELGDRSGFRLCATVAAPAHLVSLSQLGTQEIAGTSARGTCSPEVEAPIFLLAGLARMNLLGTDISLTVQRAGGGPELLYKRPFEFDEGGLDLLRGDHVQPGDTLTTECRYREEAHYGPAVDDETCDLYVLHWPARALTSGGGQGDRCLH